MRAWVRSCCVVAGVVGPVACGSVQAPAGTGDAGGGGDSTGTDAPPDAPGDGSGTDTPPPPTTPPSCMGLPKTCGQDRGDNCCNSPDVPGGTYYRSFDSALDFMFSNNSFQATVHDFRLDKYEITVGRFRKFVDAGMGTQNNPPLARSGEHAAIFGSGWDATWNSILPADKATLIAQLHCDSVTHIEMWTDSPGPNENKPLNCLTWYEAMAFCVWDGGYLATEAEWNYAATGGTDQRAYPWSVPAASLTLDKDHASYQDGVRCTGEGSPDCLVVVGSLPLGDGRYGQSDLAGNVNEWVLDYFAAYQSTCMDCAQLAPEPKRTFRGGSFGSAPVALRTASRTGNNPQTPLFSFGARCARPAR